MARCKRFLLRTDNVVPEHTADLVVAARLSNESLEDRSGASIHAEEKLDKRQGVPHPPRTFLGSHARCTDALDAIFSFLLVVWVCGSVCLSFPGVSSALVWSSFH